MKQDVMPSVVRMDKETLKNLTAEVRETIATNYVLPKAKKRFTSVNLWNIHRNRKQISRTNNKWAI